MANEVDFLSADKHKSFLHVYNHFRCAKPGMSKVPKIKKFALSLKYLKENVKD